MTAAFLKSVPGEDPIVVEGFFAATPARVYRAWTEPEAVRKWFGPAPDSLHSADIDLRQGGAWRFVESEDEQGAVGFEGEYLAIEPDHRLVFTWSKFTVDAAGGRTSTHRSQVEVVFTARGTGTDVRVVHSDIREAEMLQGFGRGWSFAFGTMTGMFAERRDAAG